MDRGNDYDDCRGSSGGGRAGSFYYHHDQGEGQADRPSSSSRGGAYVPPHRRRRQQQQQHSTAVGGFYGGRRQEQPRIGPTTSGRGRPTWRTLGPHTLNLTEHDTGLLKISERQSGTSAIGYTDKVLPVEQPDASKFASRPVRLLVNHFRVRFNPQNTIIHYKVDIKQLMLSGKRPFRRSITKSDLCLIRDKLCYDDPRRFPLHMTAYDGERNLYSAVPLPMGQFKVELSDGEDVNRRLYILTIKKINELDLSKLMDYLNGRLSYIPREILQGMDVIMKENPSRHRLSIDRRYYSRDFLIRDDLKCGAAAYIGFQQSLKPTSQGLVLCLDYSALALCKPLPVMEFLKENVSGFTGVRDVGRLRQKVINTLKGLKVRVTHRSSKKKYTIKGLTIEYARDLYFELKDPKGKIPPQRTRLIDYFREKYGKDIVHKDIPCLDLGKNNEANHVPMEFCVLVEGQRFPKELLSERLGQYLRDRSLAIPVERKTAICEMLQAEDGPCGEFTRKFEIEVDKSMTAAAGHVIAAPDLKLGSQSRVSVDNRWRWNLLDRSLVEGKTVDPWALIDFTSCDHMNKLETLGFINNLRHRGGSLGMHMAEPLVCHPSSMYDLSTLGRVEQLLRNVVEDASRLSVEKLKIIVCVMPKKNSGYKYLKWVSETRIGVVTQCCLSIHANRAHDEYLANLCLKINAKLGGSNMELIEKLPHFKSDDRVMFIGADVNHPSAGNRRCPSIAAVVGSVNWPAANRYAARVCPQEHRSEKIFNFGRMCLDLVKTYVQVNKMKPQKIIVFRDGVSDGQFDMVLNEELADLKKNLCTEHYQPTITLVVAQKRHQTRLFLENARDGNVPPGTVVDSEIVNPFEFNFYLCSHYGSLGTSRPTHYVVLRDENSFTSEELQKLIYDMCFTLARCTKPVALVPPLYYADLVAYRGRLFQEVALELQSRGSSVSSINRSFSSPSLTFDQSFYDLHPELKNIMFFV